MVYVMNYLFIDIETTGLNPQKHEILEISAIATDTNLEPLDNGYHAILHYDEPVSDFISAMHGDNGLLGACKYSELSYRQVEQGLQNYLKSKGELLIAGSSVHFDRVFLDMKLNQITRTDQFSHRVLDISAIDEAMKAWNKPAYQNRPERTTNHRTQRCLADTLNLARWYQTVIEGAPII